MTENRETDAQGVPGRRPALPSPSSREQEEIGRGQGLVIVVLALATVAVVTFALVFILPPAYVAACLAFGPVITLALCVAVAHLRAKGLSRGDPP